MPTDSLVVGCGWMVLPTSTASAPISIASAISLIRSPAPAPTIAPPISRWDSSEKMSFVKPSSLPFAIARPDGALQILGLPSDRVENALPGLQFAHLRRGFVPGPLEKHAAENVGGFFLAGNEHARAGP